jgi:hypothetical protein
MLIYCTLTATNIQVKLNIGNWMAKVLLISLMAELMKDNLAIITCKVKESFLIKMECTMKEIL